jgi:excisionase family DNA binding protein
VTENARRRTYYAAERLDAEFEERRLSVEKPWLTFREAGERLGCSPDAVRMRVRRGRLHAEHQGRRVYVSAESVDRLG